ncbi:MAG: glutamate 5-kinase [Candidatus Electronema aureum]|uniref:Glutamate 5-kinase n=1 Tax=Candidatus Electronema aureum TaxID=2005002 RepID=A0A521G016_9BACT|nr:MAG: glutamate 5-kinase [Candidatus Electronema aureum]
MTFQINRDDGLFYRQTLFDQAKTVVLKVGSAVLTNAEGLNLDFIDTLCRQISFLRSSGRKVILVTSGAVAAGRRRLGVERQPGTPLKVKQALAAVGQGLLMQAYEQRFADQGGQQVAQLLLTHADLSQRDRYLNIRNTILALFEFGVVPIINENDTVSVQELRFGDNDTLGALITNMIGADMYIMLTDVDGLYTGNPALDPTAKPIYTVARVDSSVQAMAGNSGSSLGTGGMQTKIRAAKMVAACGGSSFIGPGRNKNILKELFSGDMVGTFFLPDQAKISGRKHWIGYVLRPAGFLDLDAGACRAIVERGKSLLPSGIVRVEGSFKIGAPVHCRCPDGRVVAAGLTNYASLDIDKIKGCKTCDLTEILGFRDSDEVIHRDNLVLLDGAGNFAN